MAQIHKVEGQIELKCHADKMFDLWANKIYQIQKMCPNRVQKTVLLEGEWNKAGALTYSNYVINEIGESSSLKARVKSIDEKNKSIRYSYHDGLIMENYYKSFNSELKVSPKGNGCIMKWSFEYEKMKEDAPDASVYLDFMFAIANEIDACLCKA